MTSFSRKLFSAATGLALTVGLLVAGPATSAKAVEDPLFVDPNAYTGLTASAAAASCWEIKQLHPESASGSYWVLTPQMSGPAEVYCDMVTDGGGWVKVGQGRNGWEEKYIGKGNTAGLLAPATASSPTVQMPATLVDGLLNGQRVSTLDDGVRFRRAANIAGTTWQEVRAKLAKMDGWTWTWSAVHPVTSFSFDGQSGTGGTTAQYSLDNALRRMYSTFQTTTHNYTWGFSYGTGVTGDPSASSYLWTPTAGQGNPRPVTEVYVRPKLMNSELNFARLADSGTASVTGRKQPSSFALTNPWGVNGLAGSWTGMSDVEVQAFAQIGNTMYVGGAFAYVQRTSAGADRVNQPFLAAFNATTGEYIPSFTPTLNEAVHALAVLPNGNLFVGGRFTQVNGTTAVGAVALNPTTGAIASGWNLLMENGLGGGGVRVQAATTYGAYTYIVGAFTHGTGATGGRVYSRAMMRIDTNGRPDGNWRTEVKGGVRDIDIDSEGTRAYIAGNYAAVGDTPQFNASVFDTAAGANLAAPTWIPTYSSSNNPYQQAIQRVGDRVWLGGAEHSSFSYDADTYALLSGNITTTQGGDFQAYGATSTEVFGTCHCRQFNYSESYTWSNVGSNWTQVDSINWIGAWDATTGQYIRTFDAHLSTRAGSGPWAVAVGQTDETVWVGGDITGGRTTGSSTSWLGGFARYPQADVSAPNTPGNFRTTNVTSTTATLAWAAPAGGIGTGGRYQVLRDDRVIAEVTGTSVTVPLGGERRYFVRAMDAAGNISASTPVLQLAGGVVPPTFGMTPNGLNVTFDASASISPAPITHYLWRFGDGSTSVTTEPVATHQYLSGKTYSVSLTVRDETGSLASTSQDLELAQPTPADAYGAAVFADQPWAYWRLDEATGDLAVDSSGQAHHASYQQGVGRGAAGIVDGNAGATFDGSNDVVVASDAVIGPNTYSAEAWFKTSTTTGGKIIGFGTAASGLSSSYDRHVYMANDGKLVFGAYPGSEQRVTSAQSYNDGRWHHVVATQSSAGMVLYIDGVQAGTNPTTTGQGYTGYWRVGGDNTWGSTSRYLNGVIDEAAVYLTALSAEQVANHYQLGMDLPAVRTDDPYAQAVLADSPGAYWRLDSGKHGLVQDASGNSFDGGLVGAPTASPDSGVTDGHGSFVFSGSTQGVAANRVIAAPSVYSSEIWFRTTTTAGGKLMGTGNLRTGNSGNYDRHVYMQADGKLVAGVWTGAQTTVTTPTAYNDGQWHHVVAQSGGSTLQLFVDGVFIGQTSLPNPIQAYNGYWRLGGDTSWSGASYFAGSLDEFAVYPTTLTLSQVQTHYAVGTAVENQLPTAAISVTTDHLAVTVDGAGSTDPDGNVMSYEWNFGDGATATGVTASHTYETAGAYTITLKVTDNRGGEGTTTESVSVVAPNVAPTAHIASTVDVLTVNVTGAGSTDSDGTVVSYQWNFGDGAIATDVTASHTYHVPGTYTVTLVVKDNEGAEGTTTAQIDVGEAATVELVEMTSPWSYYYNPVAPNAAWKSIEFDDSAWVTGAAPIGYGSTLVTTNLNPAANTNDRPRVAYFRTSFNLANAAKVTSLELTGVADDGVVVYVNGAEVKRERMPAGTVTHETFASPSPPRTTAANASPFVVSVPVNLLVNGKNVISAETHVNYRGTPDLSFKLGATAEVAAVAPEVPNVAPTANISTTVSGMTVNVSGASSSDPDGTIQSYAWNFGDGATATGVTASHTYTTAGNRTVTLVVTDDDGESASTTVEVAVGLPTSVELVAESSSWRYYYDAAAPVQTWNSPAFDDSSWLIGSGPIGYGSTLISTNLNPSANTNDRPRVSYFRTNFTVEDASKVGSLELTTVADDGVVVYVNGVEVGRARMPQGTITHTTFASPTPPRTTAANASPVTLSVPVELLVNGVNVISAQTHVNYRGTPDMSFKLKAVAEVNP